MSFDILGKDIAVLFILAVIFGVATYFYVLYKGKKEGRTASAEDKIILGFEVLAFSFTFFIFFPLVVEDVFDANGSNSALWHNLAAIISYGGAAFYLFCGQISGDYFTIQKFLKKHKKHKTRAQKKEMETEKISRKHSVHLKIKAEQ